jgi:hypothetical protein
VQQGLRVEVNPRLKFRLWWKKKKDRRCRERCDIGDVVRESRADPGHTDGQEEELGVLLWHLKVVCMTMLL